MVWFCAISGKHRKHHWTHQGIYFKYAVIYMNVFVYVLRIYLITWSNQMHVKEAFVGDCGEGARGIIIKSNILSGRDAGH